MEWEYIKGKSWRRKEGSSGRRVLKGRGIKRSGVCGNRGVQTACLAQGARQGTGGGHRNEGRWRNPDKDSMRSRKDRVVVGAWQDPREKGLRKNQKSKVENFSSGSMLMDENVRMRG
jgi:hypothetical protein